MSLIEITGWDTVAKSWLASLDGESGHTGLPLNSTSIALENVRMVKSGRGTLFGFSGFNNKASAQWIQVFDKQTPPVNGDIPVITMSVPTVTTFSASWVVPGRFFSRGIALANSSTVGTLTLGSADCWFDAQYI